MARVGIIFGLLLCGVTLLGLVTTASKSPTQFIPMMLGIPVLFCGVVALNPHRRKYATRITAVIAAVGILAGATPMLASLVRMARGVQINQFELALTSSTLIACAVLLALCIVSFIYTRRRKMSNKRPPSVQLAAKPRSPHRNMSETSSREGA